MNSSRWILASGLCVFLVWGMCLSASAEDLGWSEGRWRLELQGAMAWNRDHKDDYYFIGIVEYEFPAWEHVALGLRLSPVFVYHEEKDKNQEDGWMYGAGVGFGIRWYPFTSDYSGFFLEGNTMALLHTDEFEDNDSSLNFRSEFGFGYQFECDWHLAVKYAHISNASLGDPNDGVESVALGLGYTF